MKNMIISILTVHLFFIHFVVRGTTTQRCFAFVCSVLVLYDMIRFCDEVIKAKGGAKERKNI